MTTGCVVVAAGSGTRLDAGVPKAYVVVAGRTLLEHAVQRVLDSGVVDEVVVVVPASAPAPATPPSAAPPSAVIMGSRHPGSVRSVPGGPTRQASVRCGIAALSPDVDVVLVHDAARCLAPAALVATVASAVRAGHPAVVPAVRIADTVRSLDGDTVDRSRLRAVQTPQGFARDVLERAHAAANGRADDEALAATDDAGLVERLGVDVHLVDGDPLAFKVTTPLDLSLAEALLAEQVVS